MKPRSISERISRLRAVERGITRDIRTWNSTAEDITRLKKILEKIDKLERLEAKQILSKGSFK